MRVGGFGVVVEFLWGIGLAGGVSEIFLMVWG